MNGSSARGGGRGERDQQLQQCGLVKASPAVQEPKDQDLSGRFGRVSLPVLLFACLFVCLAVATVAHNAWSACCGT